MDRNIDYGLSWAYNQENINPNNSNESYILQQLIFFHKKDLEKTYSKDSLYIKAYYLHHLLDYFKETRLNVNEIDQVFNKFLEEKVPIEYADKEGNVFNFQKEVDEIFSLLKNHKCEFLNDLK